MLFSTCQTESTKAINIFRLDVQSGTATVVTNGKVEQNPVCSSDGKFVLYSKLEKGRQVLMEIPVGGGEARQLTDKLVNFGAVSPDGKQIAALAVEGQGANAKPMIEILPSGGGLPVKSFPPSRFISGLFQYSADGQSLYYPITEKGVSNILMQTIAGGPPSLVTNFDNLFLYGYDYDWKNKRLAVARGRTNSDVVLITQQGENH